MNSSIVMAADAESPLCEHLAVLDVGLGTLAVKYVEQHTILGLARYDDNVLEVLCSGTDERYAAYVNLLDDIRIAGATGYGLLEWIKVDNHEVDGRYLILSHLIDVALIVAAGKYTSTLG